MLQCPQKKNGSEKTYDNHAKGRFNSESIGQRPELWLFKKV